MQFKIRLIVILIFATSTVHAYTTSLTSYAALGDSYAAGDGAGSPIAGTLTCGRFSDAYPIQLANNTFMQGVKFHNLACGGAVTKSILRDQLPWSDDSQVLSLTVGGNEVDFFNLLNECIHQWRPLGSCETELAKSRKMIESSTFIKNYDDMIEAIVTYLAPDARLLVTGYAKFFNARTEQCNHISFSKTNPENKLSTQIRESLNDLIGRLNDVIRAASAAHGAKYIDIDVLFEGHRFCEPDVVEPDHDREETWFFNLDYRDTASIRLSNGDLKPQSSHLRRSNPFKDFLDMTKVFHPTTLAHKAIAHELLGQIRYD